MSKPSRTTATTATARPVQVAAALTMLTGVAFVGVAIAVLATRVAVFSAGVSAMLLLYGLLVIGVGWLVWRLRPVAFGPCVTCSLIHLLVLGNLARVSHFAVFAPLCLVPLAVLFCLLTPVGRRVLGRG